MTRTSSISGTFVNRQRSPVRVAAANIFRAAFFEPLIGTSPCSGVPPSIRKTSRVTGSGWNSQWKGFASATDHLASCSLDGRRPSGMPTPTLVLAPLGDPDPEQGRLERRPRRREIGAFDVAALEGLFGLAAGRL